MEALSLSSLSFALALSLRVFVLFDLGGGIVGLDGSAGSEAMI